MISKNYFFNWEQLKKSKFWYKGKQEISLYVEVPSTILGIYLSSFSINLVSSFRLS